jgi:LPS-assembly protein
LFGRHFIQTLEPRAYFLYVPFRKQDQIPIFDSALADFNYAQLFSENRYIGNDRIGDARQITLAVSSRLLDPVTGDERLRTSIGQRYYFADQQVTLNEPLRAGRRSDYLLTATGRLSERWLVDGGYQYDTEAKHTDQLNFGVRYQPELGKTLSAGYRYTRELLDAQGLPTQIKQVDLAGQWPIGGRWYAEARWNYSLFDHKVLEAVAGLEYNGGCWALRILGQRVVTTTTAAQGATSSIFFQLELNGLGGLGTNPLEVLQRNIPNYFKFNAPVRSTEAPGQWYQPNY